MDKYYTDISFFSEEHRPINVICQNKVGIMQIKSHSLKDKILKTRYYKPIEEKYSCWRVWMNWF